jgi:hypothetical protein
MKIIKIRSCSECEKSWYDDGIWKCSKIYPKNLNQINISTDIHPDCPLDDYLEYYDEMLLALIEDALEYEQIIGIGGFPTPPMEERYIRNIKLIEHVTGKSIYEVIK